MIVLRGVVAGIWLVSVVLKVDSWVRLGEHVSLLGVVGVLLEVIVVALLLSNRLVRIGFVASALLCAVYVAWALLNADTVAAPCSCFGQQVRVQTAWRLVLLGAVGLVSVLGTPRRTRSTLIAGTNGRA